MRGSGTYLALKTFLACWSASSATWRCASRGLEFAGFWAVIIAVLNYVPYIGSVLSILLPGVMAVAQFANAREAVELMLSLAIVQFLIGNFLDPYVMGNSLNLSPFAILVSLAVWVALWGVRRRLPRGADRRDDDDHLLGIQRHPAHRGAAVAERQ